MADQTSTHLHDETGERTEALVLGGSLAEGIASGAAVALSILALIGAWPYVTLSVATICIGAAFMFEGGAISRQFETLLAREARTVDISSLGGGLTAEYIAGAAGIALGILALIGIAPLYLMPIAAIVFGGALLIGSGTVERLNDYAIKHAGESQFVQNVSHEAIRSTANLRVLIGLGAITLGILALAGVAPLTCTIVAMLIVAGADLMSGTALSGRMVNIFNR
jgi:hypothetical protein